MPPANVSKIEVLSFDLPGTISRGRKPSETDATIDRVVESPVDIVTISRAARLRQEIGEQQNTDVTGEDERNFSLLERTRGYIQDLYEGLRYYTALVRKYIRY